VRRVAFTIGLCAVLVAGAGTQSVSGESEAHARPAAAGPDALARSHTREAEGSPCSARGDSPAKRVVARSARAVPAVGGVRGRAAPRGRVQTSAPVLLLRSVPETRPPRFERIAPSPSSTGRGATSRCAIRARERSAARLYRRAHLCLEWLRAPTSPASQPAPSRSCGAVRASFSRRPKTPGSAGASAVIIANEGVPGRTAPIAATLVRPGIGILVLAIRPRSARSSHSQRRRAPSACGSRCSPSRGGLERRT
jgi:hypothetical protein